MNYASEALTGDETLRLRMNRMGFILKKVQKSKPLKKIPQTNAIFNQLAVVNKTAHANESVLRISMDAKAVVKMGELSRHACTRAPTVALENGSILDRVEAVVGCASSMTWKGRHPVVKRINTVYEKGVTLSKVAMRAVEEKLQRLPSLPRGFVTIEPGYVPERQ